MEARLGILMLEGKMAAVPGCMAGPATFPYPVLRRVVRGSRPPASAADVEALAPLYLAAGPRPRARGGLRPHRKLQRAHGAPARPPGRRRVHSRHHLRASHGPA